MIDEKLLYLWLSLSGMSSTKKYKLIQELSPFEVYDAIGRGAELDSFLGGATVERMIKSKPLDFLSRELDRVYEAGISIVTIDDPLYPEGLKQESVSPPLLLYCKGDTSLLRSTSVSIVGTRASSAYGRDVAEMMAREICGYNITIVSGMASGIDAYTHHETLKAGGKTIAVLGSGLKKPTPASNSALFRQICEVGLVVSEYPINADASKYTFPERNRIISGLSTACIVVEASVRSGSLITANFALEQGRELFVVPGNITSPKSEGTNNLIKNGARVLTSPMDILSFYNVSNIKTNKNNTLPPLDFFEETIYNLLKNENLNYNELSQRSGFTIKEVLTIVASLELAGDVVVRSGNIVESKKLRG